MSNPELLHTWLREIKEAKTAVLEARNTGLAYIDRGGPLGEAAEMVDAMYWDLEHAVGTVRVELQSQ